MTEPTPVVFSQKLRDAFTRLNLNFTNLDDDVDAATLTNTTQDAAIADVVAAIAAIATQTQNDARFVNEIDHTKPVHDALAIDADLVDGQHAAALLARANHTGTQPSTSVSDFVEAVQDRLGADLVAGTGVTLSYDDAGTGRVTITSSAAGGATDPEIVRDVIGAAIVAGVGIQVTVNDIGDTITITATDATTTGKGVVQLAGDLGGTAAAPTVPGLTAHVGSRSGHPLATATLDGLMGGTTDKAKLDGVAPGAQVNPTATQIINSTELANDTHNAAVAATAYPSGLSIMRVTTANADWPTTFGTVITEKTAGPASQRFVQSAVLYTAFRVWDPNTLAWSSWDRIVDRTHGDTLYAALAHAETTPKDYGATGIDTETSGTIDLAVTSTTGPNKVTLGALNGFKVGGRIWVKAAKLTGPNLDQWMPLVATITAINGLVVTHNGTADRAVTNTRVAHDATSALQDAIDASGVVRLTEGVYRISAQLNIPFERTIVGAGYASRIKKQPDPRNGHWCMRTTQPESGGGGRIALDGVWIEGDWGLWSEAKKDWDPKTAKDYVGGKPDYQVGDLIKPTGSDPTTNEGLHIYRVTEVRGVSATAELARHYQTLTEMAKNVRIVPSDTTETNRTTRRMFSLTAISGGNTKATTPATEPNWAGVAIGGTVTQTNAQGVALTWTESGAVGFYYRTDSGAVITHGNLTYEEYSGAKEPRCINFRTASPETPTAHVFEVSVRNCAIVNWPGVSYRMEGIDRLSMVDSLAYKNTRGGFVAAFAGYDTVISGCRAIDMGDDCIAVNANIPAQARHERFSITGNICSSRSDAEYGAGIIVRGGAEGTITGNTITNAKNAGISLVDYFGSVIRNITVVGNTIRFPRDGVELTSDSMSGIKISENNISSPYNNGIVWKNATSVAAFIEDIEIEGNRIRSAGDAQNPTGDGILLAGAAGDLGSGVSVVNNKVRQSARGGITVGVVPGTVAGRIAITNLKVDDNQVSDSARFTSGVAQIHVQNGRKVRIKDNMVTEQRTTPLTSSGVRIGNANTVGSYSDNFSLGQAGSPGIVVDTGADVTNEGGNKV